MSRKRFVPLQVHFGHQGFYILGKLMHTWERSESGAYGRDLGLYIHMFAQSGHQVTVDPIFGRLSEQSSLMTFYKEFNLLRKMAGETIMGQSSLGEVNPTFAPDETPRIEIESRSDAFKRFAFRSLDTDT